MVAPPSFAAADEEPGLVVGRIYHVEGDLLRYVPEEKDWVATVPDAPFGTGDTLFSGSSGMAELIIPNGVWVRTGNNTQIQFIALDDDLAEMDVASGIVRIYAKGQAAVKVTSPFGYVQADPGTIFDLYVGENSVEVVSVKGTVSFVHSATGGRYDVAAGSVSILADAEQVSTGDGTVDPDWNRWNMERENYWLAKAEVKGPSAEYLPPELRNDAYALEENGSWDTVYYEGEPRRCWRPTRVAVGWSPFTVGHWTDWYGDQTWIPGGAFRLCHPPLRQLDIRRTLLVLVSAGGRRARWPSAPQHRILLVSGKGCLDSQRDLRRLGAAGTAARLTIVATAGEAGIRSWSTTSTSTGSAVTSAATPMWTMPSSSTGTISMAGTLT